MAEDYIEFYDLTFVLKGTLVYIINDEEITLRRGDAILLPPGTKRQRLAGKSSVTYISFNFLLFHPLAEQTGRFIPNGISNEMIDICSTYSQISKTDPLFAKEKLMNLLNYILIELLGNSKPAEYSPRIVKAVKFIEGNLNKNISLVDLSRHLHLSKEYVAALFKQELGKTAGDYINDAKMNYAKELIQEKQFSLTEISDFLGYSSYNYFSRIFKKTYRISPHQYDVFYQNAQGKESQTVENDFVSPNVKPPN